MIAIVSSTRPVIFRSPVHGRLCVAGGTIISMNGDPVVGYPEVPEGTVVADLDWRLPTRPATPAIRTVQVEGRSGTYTVTLGGVRPTCTCPGYRFRRTCTHVRQFV